MNWRILLLMLVCCIFTSCISFNTGAKLDSIGKAVPTEVYRAENQYYKLHGSVYKEILVEYMQLCPRALGHVRLHNINTCYDPLPADDTTHAPSAELYLAKLEPNRDGQPNFIRAIDFNYVQAECVDKQNLTHLYLPKEYFIYNDALTLMPSLYESNPRVLRELPTLRTTGNKCRLPLSAILTYGIDVPLTCVSYIIGAVAQLICAPFGL